MPAPTRETWLVDDFEVTLVMVDRADGPPVIRELHVVPRPDRPTADITTRWLRSLRLGDLAGAMLSDRNESEADDAIRSLVQADAGAGPDLRAALTARAYLAVLATGAPRPANLIAEELGLSIHAIRQRIAHARKRGLLTEAEAKGQAGGQLTPEALRILTEHDKKGD